MNKQKSIKFIVLNIITAMLISTFTSNIFAAPSSQLINSNNTSGVNNINTDNIDIVGGAYGELLNSLDQYCVKLANSVGLYTQQDRDRIKQNFNIFSFISNTNYSNLNNQIISQEIYRESYSRDNNYIFSRESIPGIIMEQVDYKKIESKQQICRSIENITDSFKYAETLIRSTFGNKYNRALEQSKKYIDSLEIKKVNRLGILDKETDTITMKDPIHGNIEHTFVEYKSASQIYREAQIKYPNIHKFPGYQLGHEQEFWDKIDKKLAEEKAATNNNKNDKPISLLEMTDIKIGGAYKDILSSKKKYCKKDEYNGTLYNGHRLISPQAIKLWSNKIKKTEGINNENSFLTDKQILNWIPSIIMEQKDLRQLPSQPYPYKYKRVASSNYRKNQAQIIIEKGDIIGVIDDEIKFIEDTFGHKYDRAIKEVREYIDSLNIRQIDGTITMNNPYNKGVVFKYDSTKNITSQNASSLSINKTPSQKTSSQNNNNESPYTHVLMPTYIFKQQFSQTDNDDLLTYSSQSDNNIDLSKLYILLEKSYFKKICSQNNDELSDPCILIDKSPSSNYYRNNNSPLTYSPQNKLSDTYASINPYVSINNSPSRKISSQNNNYKEDESALPSKKAPK